MNNSWKNILPIAIVIILLAGVGYLGFKVINFDKTPTISTAPIITEENIDETLTTSDAPPGGPAVDPDSAELAKADECSSSDQCTVISEQQKGATGSLKTVIQCLNKEYLKTCSNCKTSEELVAETAKESTCGCVNNYCESVLNQ
jgi:hypothetical protein